MHPGSFVKVPRPVLHFCASWEDQGAWSGPHKQIRADMQLVQAKIDRTNEATSKNGKAEFDKKSANTQKTPSPVRTAGKDGKKRTSSQSAPYRDGFYMLGHFKEC